MRYSGDLCEGVLLARRKRFFADVLLDDGREVVAHCVNSGSMRGVLRPGQRVRISPADNPKRKLRWTWEQVRVGRTWVGVNTVLANRIVEEGLRKGRFPAAAGYPDIARERKYGREGSRVDFLLEAPDRPSFALEVKNVSMAEGPRGLFPDSVTERGRKHLRELAAEVRAGRRAAVLFLVPRGDVRVFSSADAIDPAYGRALRWAAREGVELFAHRAILTRRDIRLGPAVEVDLSPGRERGASWLDAKPRRR